MGSVCYAVRSRLTICTFSLLHQQMSEQSLSYVWFKSVSSLSLIYPRDLLLHQYWKNQLFQPCSSVVLLHLSAVVLNQEEEEVPYSPMNNYCTCSHCLLPLHLLSTMAFNSSIQKTCECENFLVIYLLTVERKRSLNPSSPFSGYINL